jgi:hypothetical protein
MAKRFLRFVETFRGSSIPTKSETTDGALCVIKMRGAGNGASALLSEFIVNRLAAQAGLPVPDAFVVEFPLDHPWTFGTDEFYDIVKQSGGPNLGLDWIDHAQPIPPVRYNTLPDELVSQVVTLDLVFANWDRSEQSTNLLEDRNRRAWIIDHGSCRFLFQPEATLPRTLPLNHIFTDWAEAFDARWLTPMNTPLIDATLLEIPNLWLRETNLSRDTIRQKIDACLRCGRER